LDKSNFGSNGIDVVPEMGTAGYFYDQLHGLALDSSGNMVAVGEGLHAPGVEFLVARLTPSGSLDTTFGAGNGYVFTDVGQGTVSSVAQAVQIESNGHIAVGGRTGGDGFALARYNTDGTLDTAFNGTGSLRYYTPNYTFEAGYALGIASGNYVVAGELNGDFETILVDPPVGGSPSTAAGTSPSLESTNGTPHQGIPAPLAIALLPGPASLTVPVATTSSLKGSFQQTPSTLPTLAAVGETRIGQRAETLSGGVDEDVIDQVFIVWQVDDADAVGT
jgi:uncharacterized delta-60 repeat protein